ISIAPSPIETSALSLPDALPIFVAAHRAISSSSAGCAANSLPSSASTASRGDLPATSTISAFFARGGGANTFLTTVGEPLRPQRSEEHTSELQSRENLVCRLLLE